MRGMAFACVLILIASLGCAASSGGTKSGGEQRKAEKRGGKVVKTVDGLVKQEINIPGVLFLRPDHGIGSYDAFLLSPVAINYKRKSRHLNSEMEEEFKAQLRESLVEASNASGIPIREEPGACVMQVGFSLVDVDLKRSHSSATLGRMTLVMEFRDSTSGEPLLRFATLNQIENDERAGSRTRQMRRSFDEMLTRMDVGTALAEAGLSDRSERSGCQGLLAKRTQSLSAPVSAR